jgi:hypothetical protein
MSPRSILPSVGGSMIMGMGKLREEKEAYLNTCLANIDFAFLIITPLSFFIFNAVYWAGKE